MAGGARLPRTPRTTGPPARRGRCRALAPGRPCGFVREEEDERGGREERGAPPAFPGFQGPLEPLKEIIGRNGVWRGRRPLAPLLGPRGRCHFRARQPGCLLDRQGQKGD